MNGRLLVQLGWMFGSLSLIAVGGANVLIPEIQHQVVETRGWIDSTHFAQLFAISQAAPGPNVMLASIIGWHVAGLSGLLVATIAILTPSGILALLAGRGIRRWQDHWVIRVSVSGLVPLALGLMIASGIVASRAATAGLTGYSITAAIALLVVFTKRNPLVLLAFGTAIFLACHYLEEQITDHRSPSACAACASSYP